MIKKTTNGLPASVWVVDDDASICWVLEKAFTKAGFSVRSFNRGEKVLQALDKEQPDVMVSDIRMPGISGLELLEQLGDLAPTLPVVIMTAHSDLDSAVASYKQGAFEYLPKPFDVKAAVELVTRALEQQGGGVDSGERPRPPEAMLGAAPAMQEVFRVIGRLSSSDMSVLVRGESGTGKELVARALYENSPRANKPFIAINTAAIPKELLESELFGHEKGAFTGAHARHAGRFEQADGGTLFLDEIGDMPAELQTRLLRVLSEGRFYRVGGRQQIEVDVRVIAATNQDLEARVESDRFRIDLFHRLNVIGVDLPPLRERPEDIPLLTRRFLERAAAQLQVDAKQLSPEVEAVFERYRWPGNVRELENLCQRLTVMAPGQRIDGSDLPPGMVGSTGESKARSWEDALRQDARKRLGRGERMLLQSMGPAFERVLLKAALEFTGGHKQAAAKALGWGRNTLTRKMKELGVG
ncbi:MAG: nitrogen regulation protein NR(I) [Pseudomonadota bacterium]|nr:nitrogen regulation protein NR(I) [Pseudomonadota bacterium]